jgi:hypothetical protein
VNSVKDDQDFDFNTTAKGAVITCRAWPQDLEAIDLLIEAGIRTTRSDAAAWLIHAGVEAHRELFERVQTTVADIRRLRREAQVIARAIDRVASVASDAPKVDSRLDQSNPGSPSDGQQHALEGHCRCCGKALSVSRDTYRGIGPVCYRQLQNVLHLTAADARARVENDNDEEWLKLIDELREALKMYSPTEVLQTVPQGYVEMSKWWRETEKRGLRTSAVKRAVGGDRALGPFLGEEFQPVFVQVGNRTRKYLPPEVWLDEAFEKIRATEGKG